jgi:hypothetical protein
MTIKTYLCLSALTLALLTSCPPPPKTRVIFIFCDVTNSLVEQESAKVATHAADVLDGLPPGSLYRLYPIQAETGQLAPLEQGKIEREDNPNVEKGRKRSRRQRLSESLAQLYKVTNVNRYDNRTCILNTLGFASNQLRDFPADKYQRELVFISDMLEECDATPLRQSVDIRKADIGREVKLAGDFPQGIDFSGVIINIITPTTIETYRNYDPKTRPQMDALQEFWFTVFKRCNVAAESIQNPERFYWSNGVLPNRYTQTNLSGN